MIVTLLCNLVGPASRHHIIISLMLTFFSAKNKVEAEWVLCAVRFQDILTPPGYGVLAGRAVKFDMANK